MGYANLVSQACGDNADVFKRVRDYLCSRNGTYDYSSSGLGWTLHDAVYATDEDNVAFGDYFVAYSPGEDGNQDIYIKVTYASGYINVHAYLYWNATTHSGVTAATTANNWTATNSTSATLWIYGDLDSIVLIALYGSSYYATFAGHCPDSIFATDVATSASAVSSGSNVVVSVDAVPYGWEVGRKVYIRDIAGIEIVTILEISGTNVTLSSVANSYSAGCKLQGEYSVFCSGSTSSLASIYAVISHAGASPSLHNIDSTSVSVSGVTDDGLVGGSPFTSNFFSNTTSIIGPVKHIYQINATGRTNEDTETDNNGNTYRYFQVYNSKEIVVPEV